MKTQCLTAWAAAAALSASWAAGGSPSGGTVFWWCQKKGHLGAGFSLPVQLRWQGPRPGGPGAARRPSWPWLRRPALPAAAAASAGAQETAGSVLRVEGLHLDSIGQTHYAVNGAALTPLLLHRYLTQSSCAPSACCSAWARPWPRPWPAARSPGHISDTVFRVYFSSRQKCSFCQGRKHRRQWVVVVEGKVRLLPEMSMRDGSLPAARILLLEQCKRLF